LVERGRLAGTIDRDHFERAAHGETPVSADERFRDDIDSDRHGGAADTLDACGQFDQFADANRFVKLDLVGCRHHHRAARAARRRDERSLAHQAQCIAAEQRAVMVGLLRKNHLDETRR